MKWIVFATEKGSKDILLKLHISAASEKEARKIAREQLANISFGGLCILSVALVLDDGTHMPTFFIPKAK